MVASATLDAITTGFSTKFRDGFARMSASTNWGAFADEATSSGKTTIYPIKGHGARMRKWFGDRILREQQVYGYSLTNVKFEDTIKVRVEDVEDDSYALYNNQMEDLGAAAARLPYDELIQAIKDGDATACFDGEYFFDTDHPQDPFGHVSTTWSNSLSSTSLTSANVASTRTAMKLLKDEYGTLLGVDPTHIVVPAALQKTAEEIVGPLALTYHYTGLSTSNTSSAPSNVMRGALGIIVIPDLDADSSTTWYMADLGKPVKPLFWQWRVRPQFQRITDANSEYVLRNDEYVFGARARGAAGYSLPHLMFRCAA